MKLSYVDLMEIIEALAKLGEERKLPVAVEVARNLRIIQTHMKELNEDIKTLQNQWAKKDENGHLVSRNEDGTGLVFETPEDERSYRAAVVDLHDQPVEVSFITFDIERLKKVEVSALVVAPLLGRVITGVKMDDEPDKKVTENDDLGLGDSASPA